MALIASAFISNLKGLDPIVASAAVFSLQQGQHAHRDFLANLE